MAKGAGSNFLFFCFFGGGIFKEEGVKIDEK